MWARHLVQLVKAVKMSSTPAILDAPTRHCTWWGTFVKCCVANCFVSLCSPPEVPDFFRETVSQFKMYWKQSRRELSSSVFGLCTYKGQTFSTGAFFVGASTLAVRQRSTLTRFPKIGDFDMFQRLFFRFKHGILFSSSRRSKWVQYRPFWTLLLDTYLVKYFRQMSCLVSPTVSFHCAVPRRSSNFSRRPLVSLKCTENNLE